MPSTQTHTAPSRGTGPGPRLLTAATLEGDKVVNLRHELLGTVRDITVDVQTGHIAYLLMAREGAFGVAEKLFAIPWHSLTLDPVRKCFVLDMAQDKLNEAPSFDHGHWPDKAADPAWVSELHHYFGTPPAGKS